MTANPADIVERLLRQELLYLDDQSQIRSFLDDQSELHRETVSLIKALQESVSALEAERQNIIATKREQIAALQRIAQVHKEHAREQRAEIMELREALEFYAEPKNYKGKFVPGGPTEHGTYALAHHVNLVRRDGGKRARTALQEAKDA